MLVVIAKHLTKRNFLARVKALFWLMIQRNAVHLGMEGMEAGVAWSEALVRKQTKKKARVRLDLPLFPFSSPFDNQNLSS